MLRQKTVDSTDGKGTPTQAIIDNVIAVINFSPDTSLPDYDRGRRPTDVRLYVVPVTPKNIIINIPSFQGLTAQITSDITTALTAYLATIRPFIAGADVITNKNDTVNTNGIIQTISNTIPGASYGTVTFTVSGVLVTEYIFTLGEIPYLQIVDIT